MVEYHDHYQQRRTRNLLPPYSQPPTSLNSTKLEDDLQLLSKISKPGGLTILSPKTSATLRIG